jgi:hypothetical protein
MRSSMHEVPGTGVWTFKRAKLTARPGELGFLSVEGDSQARRAEKPSPGFSLGFWFRAEALKGAPADEAPRNIYPEMPVAPSGLLTLGCLSQGKPWAELSWPVGPKTRTQALGNVPNSSLGTSCLASHPLMGSLIKLTLGVSTPGTGHRSPTHFHPFTDLPDESSYSHQGSRPQAFAHFGRSCT